MEKTRQSDGVLHARLFADFALDWNGEPLIKTSRTQHSQFTYLLQLLLHFGSEGVPRGLLQETLFEDREIDDIRHTMRNLIYATKRRLRAAGLPDADYIVQRNGVYYWTEQIPVESDAAEMDRLYSAAEREEDPAEQQRLYLAACHIYTGEFLPGQSSMIWVSQQARKYRQMFRTGVRRAAEQMRRTHSFVEMKELGIYAAKVDPWADWEELTMEALVGLGLFDEAGDFYDRTVRSYIQDQGLRPTKRMLELADRLANQIERPYEVLNEIQSHLTENDDHNMNGGYLCSYPVLQGIYRTVERLMERGGPVQLMLCTVVDSKGNPMKDGPSLNALSTRLCDAIVRSVRHSDTVCKYGRGQYLILLVNTTKENCGVIQRRINSRFLVGRQRTGVHYSVNGVVSIPEEAPK